MTSSKPSLAGKCCLVVDDEFLIALDIQYILEAAGAASVVCAGSAAEALAALQHGPKFDLAVLDVKLSETANPSLTVATALLEQETPFVFLTGMRAGDIHGGKFPAAPVVEKPYQEASLIDAALRALASR